jgi:ATP synthase protein I
MRPGPKGSAVPPDPDENRDDPGDDGFKKEPKSEGGGGQDLWKFVGAGTQLTVTVLLFVGLGYWLDQRYGWSPWGILSFGMLGVAAGLYHFVKDALK